MELIKINPDHYIIVDDSEIKEGDYILMNWSIIRQCDYIDGYMLIDTTQGKHHISICDKITHSTQPLENLNGTLGWKDVEILPLPEVKELLREVDVEEKSYQFIKEIGGTREQRLAYIDGYREALEDNKHMRFTYDELLTLALRCWNTASNPMERSVNNLNKIVDEYIQRFEPTSWNVEFVDGKIKLK